MSAGTGKENEPNIFLDERGAGECPQWLFIWRLGIRHVTKQDLATAYSRLGCIDIMVGHSVNSGLAQQATQHDVRKFVASYCLAFHESKGNIPVGLHRIRMSRDDIRPMRFKFPDRALPLCWPAGRSIEFSPGRAAVLERDWYLNGHKVHRLSPDDPPEVILRSPIRNLWDAMSVALAVTDALTCAGRLQSRSGALSAEELAEELARLVDSLARERGYPVNLAEAYRHLKAAANGGPGTAGILAETIARYAHCIDDGRAGYLEEAARIRKALFPETAL